MIGRKLNVRLAELKMNSKESMSTKDQLQKLFEHERDAMLEHLEDVAMIARRYGRPRILKSSNSTSKTAGLTDCLRCLT